MAACAAASSSSLSSPNLRFIPSNSNPRPKSLHSFSCFLTTLSSSSPPLIPSLTLSKTRPIRFKISQNPIDQTLVYTLRKPRKLKASATSVEDAPISAQEIVSATSGDDGVSNVVSSLLLIAFIGLSILTIGVVYIAVTDFLQKREKERFEKEEADNKKKKGGKKVKARARAGPRGFGQKVDEEDEYND